MSTEVSHVAQVLQQKTRGFGSDNWAGAHLRFLEAIAHANEGHLKPYGYDSFSVRACELACEIFGDINHEYSQAYLVLNGVGSNIFSLSLLARGFGGIICAETAHINTDEAGANEAVVGAKLLTVKTPDGKLTPHLIEAVVHHQPDEHRVAPVAVSVSNLTELGTSYTPQEMKAICDVAHAHNLLVHVDGARIANAAVEQGVSIASLTGDAGVDIVGIGGTKNGMLYGEAVVVRSTVRCAFAQSIRKRITQLASKGRYIGAQFIEMYSDGLYAELAGQANSCTQALEEKLGLLGYKPRYARGGNQLFIEFPKSEALVQLAASYGMSPILNDENHNTVMFRFVCAWDSTLDDVDQFIAELQAL